jgi:hypothetical protein
MKKIRIILLVILVIVIKNWVFSDDIKLLPDKPTKEFMNLSKEEIWDILKAERLDLYIALKDNEKLIKSINDLSNDIDYSNKLLINSNKKLNESSILLSEKYPSNSLNIFLIAGLDYSNKYKEIGFDCYINLAYKKYFYYNRIYFQIGAGFKFYDNYGGSLNIGLGFNWR